MENLILFIAIFLIRLPPLDLRMSQLFPLTTHVLVKMLSVFLFFIVIINRYAYFQKKYKNSKFLNLIFLYLISINLSVVGATNLLSFLSAIEKYYISITLFFIIFFLLNKKNLYLFLLALIIPTILNLIFQHLIYFLPNSFKTIQEFLYQKYVEFNTYQFGRNRFFGSTFDEVLIPTIMVLILKQKNIRSKLLFFLTLLAIIFISVASNWRTKSTLSLFGLLGGFFIISRYKNIKKERIARYIFLLVIGVFFTIYISNIVTLNVTKTNVFDRLFFSDESNNMSTLISRFDYWDEALKIGQEYPIFGAGVGNYFDNLSSRTQRQATTLIANRRFILIDDPHNIFFNTFSTMGIFGLFSLIVLLVYFFISDIKVINKDLFLQSFIMSFWLLFGYGLLNPTTSFDYMCFFWIIRGFIEKFKQGL